MKILADECVYLITSETLRRAGHDVTTAQDAALAGADDNAVLAVAVRTQAVLVTNDMHFSSILNFPPSRHHGVIVLKIRPRNQAKVHLLLTDFLRNKSQSDLDQTLVIIDQTKYRIRHGKE